MVALHALPETPGLPPIMSPLRLGERRLDCIPTVLEYFRAVVPILVGKDHLQLSKVQSLCPNLILGI